MSATGKRLLAVVAALLFLSGCQNQGISKATPQTTTGNTAIGTSTTHIQHTPSPFLANSPLVAQSTIAPITPSETKPASTEVAPVELAFVGDIMLGRSLAQKITLGKGGDIFESVRTVLQSADLTVGNLECAIGDGGKKAVKGYTFLAPPLSASELKNAGFDLLSLANNHSLDYGTDVFRQTQLLLKENGM